VTTPFNANETLVVLPRGLRRRLQPLERAFQSVARASNESGRAELTATLTDLLGELLEEQLLALAIAIEAGVARISPSAWTKRTLRALRLYGGATSEPPRPAPDLPVNVTLRPLDQVLEVEGDVFDLSRTPARYREILELAKARQVEPDGGFLAISRASRAKLRAFLNDRRAELADALLESAPQLGIRFRVVPRIR
jgi:hypothetical protein